MTAPTIAEPEEVVQSDVAQVAAAGPEANLLQREQDILGGEPRTGLVRLRGRGACTPPRRIWASPLWRV